MWSVLQWLRCAPSNLPTKIDSMLLVQTRALRSSEAARLRMMAKNLVTEELVDDDDENMSKQQSIIQP